MCVLYFGWPNQPSSGTMKIPHWNVITLDYIGLHWNAEHFLSSPNHTANDMLLIPIEKIFSNRDSIRKAREAYLIQKGKTIDPAGLNIREETY